MNKNKPSPEYSAWSSMKQRCYDKNYHNYSHYGGRGIKVCDEWLHNFKAFYDYIGKRPSNRYSLDRIDVNGDYRPGNVRWANFYQQNNNLQKKYEHPGVRVRKSGSYQVRIGYLGKRICVGEFKNIDDADKAYKEASDYYSNK